MVAGNDRVFFHVSSKRSCKETNSDKFADAIKKALLDMKEIFN